MPATASNIKDGIIIGIWMWSSGAVTTFQKSGTTMTQVCSYHGEFGPFTYESVTESSVVLRPPQGSGASWWLVSNAITLS